MGLYVVANRGLLKAVSDRTGVIAVGRRGCGGSASARFVEPACRANFCPCSCGVGNLMVRGGGCSRLRDAAVGCRAVDAAVRRGVDARLEAFECRPPSEFAGDAVRTVAERSGVARDGGVALRVSDGCGGTVSTRAREATVGLSSRLLP